MTNRPDWKVFGSNDKCSIRDCSMESTKRIDLAVVGTRRYAAFGGPDKWKGRVGSVSIAVCDRCSKLLDGEEFPIEMWGEAPLLGDPPNLKRPKASVAAWSVADFIHDFIQTAVQWAKEERRRRGEEVESEGGP